MRRFFARARKSQQRSHHPTRQLRLERLEDRSLLAGAAGLLRSLSSSALRGSGGVAALTDDRFENNDSLGSATNLGTISATQSVPGLVMADSADWFRFATTTTGTTSDSVSISFLHAQGDLDMYLYNANGQSLRGSTGVGNSETISLNGLAAGTYYLRVYGYRGVFNPSYSLTLNRGSTTPPPPAPTDDVYENNDTISTAASLGTLTADTTRSGLVMADAHDWYSFTMNGAGVSGNVVSISFTHTQGNLNLELYNSQGTRIRQSVGTTNTEQISLSGLAAGTYRIHVYGYQGALNPAYSLRVNPGVPVTPPPTPPPTSSNFNIQFRFTGLTTAEQAIFTQAAAKWQSVITGDLPNATYNGIAVDDLLIDASAVSIDGQGSILGQAGPDRFRSGTSLPYHGVMQFDSADMAWMINNGTFLGVILHEMGHVLGIGTLWTAKGLLAGRGTSNPRFTGPRAVAEYNAIFGVNATGVPVENTGGSGTRDSHWKDTIFGSELMTGWIGPGNTLPMSRVTVGSLADLGYTVNMAAADYYVPSSGGLAAAQSLSSGGSGSGSNLVGAPLADLQHLPEMESLAQGRRFWESAVDALLADRRRLRGLFQ
jgi:hypothetical protein